MPSPFLIQILIDAKFMCVRFRYYVLLLVAEWCHVCVCCFILLNRYWGIVTVPGSFLKSEDLGRADFHPQGHLNYVAGYTGPLLFLFEQTHNYYVNNQGLVPWRLSRKHLRIMDFNIFVCAFVCVCVRLHVYLCESPCLCLSVYQTNVSSASL